MTLLRSHGMLKRTREVVMSVTAKRSSAPPLWLSSLFDRIVCGVDGTESSLAAVRQVARLLPARRILELVAVAEEMPAWSSSAAEDERNRRYSEARNALAQARRIQPRAYGRVCVGDPGPTLASIARETPATLLAVGAPSGGRLGGHILGSVGTHLLHNATCSVLIARPCISPDRFPHSIVVGHDGSKSAAAAADLAGELAHRFGAHMRLVAATGGAPVARDRLAQEEDGDWCGLNPVDALTTASKDADLLILGNRGLRGINLLHSVSERVGHLAHCSVLVLREPTDGDDDVMDAVPDIEC